MVRNLSEHFIAVLPGVEVALPGVYGECLASDTGFRNSLAEREIRFPGVRTQFNEQRWLDRGDQIAGERNVA